MEIMDFKIKCYIEHPSYNPTKPLFLENPELQYIDINNEREIIEKVISHKNFDTVYIQMTITITANDSCLLGFEFDSGLSIWSDYICAIEELIQEGKVNQFYGIDSFRLEMELLDKDNLFICMYHEWQPSKKYIEEILPAKEFLYALVLEIKNFLYKLKNYGALDRKPRCEEEKSHIVEEISIFNENLQRVESLGEKIKCYFK